MTSLGALGRFRASATGIQRFDPRRDLRSVVGLLEIGFREDLEARDRRWLSDLAALGQVGAPLGWMLRLLPAPAAAFDGFVYYLDGRLVGNLSLMRASRDVWIIANVVTHPDYRRRGIAADLIDIALDRLEDRRARQVQLQVRTSNAAAHGLYAGFGFWLMNSAATLRLPRASARIRPMSPARAWRPRRVVGPGGWARARRLLARAGELDRGGPTSLTVQALEHHGLWDGLDDWLRARSRQTWAAEAGGEYRAVVALLSPLRHGPHRLDLVVDPGWCGRCEAGLLDLALNAFAARAPFEVEAEVDCSRHSVLEAMQAAGFRELRRLDRLAFDFRQG